jgi:hypothetical protein
VRSRWWAVACRLFVAAGDHDGDDGWMRVRNAVVARKAVLRMRMRSTSRWTGGAIYVSTMGMGRGRWMMETISGL